MLQTSTTPQRFTGMAASGWRTDHEPPHALVAEHDVELLGQIADALSLDGYSVATARSGEQIARYLRLALGGWQRFRVPDLVVFDIDLPDADRAAIVTRLHLCDSALPVVLLSRPGARELPAVAYGAVQLTKPFDIDDLRMVALNLLPVLH